MIPRVLEPEVMDTYEEAEDYDAMDHAQVNRDFVDDLLAGCPGGESDTRTQLLDVGTGTGLMLIELARRGFAGSMTGIDLSREMLRVGRRNLSRLESHRILLEYVDAKKLPYPDGAFDVAMSNSIIHHIPSPVDCLAEMIRVVRPGGLLFVRDLLRPESVAQVEHLVKVYAALESVRQQQLFRQSLHAALAVEELQDLLGDLGIPADALRQTSDRHWTVNWRRES